MDEISSLADQIHRALQARNVRMLDAAFAGDSIAILDGETTTVDVLAEVVAESFTPFASVASSTLESSELDELLEVGGRGGSTR